MSYKWHKETVDLLRHFHRFLLPLSITNPNIKIQKNEKVDLHTALCPYFRCGQRSGKVCILFHRRRNGSQSGKWYRDVSGRTAKRAHRRWTFIVHPISGSNDGNHFLRDKLCYRLCRCGYCTGYRKEDLQQCHLCRRRQKPDWNRSRKSQEGRKESRCHYFRQRRPRHSCRFLRSSGRP